jgi:hypothetical protein
MDFISIANCYYGENAGAYADYLHIAIIPKLASCLCAQQGSM